MEYLNALQSAHDDHKPSLFELLSEQQLSALLPPSLRYLLAVATHRSPRYLLHVLNSFDEIYALLSLVVERYYLRTFGGGFTEHFYGLKRERVLSVKGGEVRRAQLGAPGQVREALRLRTSDVWRNLAVMVGLPYLKRKLDESYDIHAAPANSTLIQRGVGPQYIGEELPVNASMRQRIMYYYKWFLRRVYPSVNAAYYFSILAFAVLYLFDNSKYPSPFLWLINTRLRRMGAADYHAIDTANQQMVERQSAQCGRGISGILDLKTLYPKALSSLRFLLPTSVFALKFLEWWHASDFSRQLSRKAAEGIELPPPVADGSAVIRGRGTNARASSQPMSDVSTKTTKTEPPVSSLSFLPIFTVAPPVSSDLCPICLNPISNPTACQTGYVFDYTCIFKWIEGKHARQEAFMKGEPMSEWEEEISAESAQSDDPANNTSKEGKWESGMGRCAVTGRRVLGGTSGLRRVMV
ncbi:MAG: hypothetical protein Q9160_006716 [Pyrenula sp. 1 TL-2023]